MSSKSASLYLSLSLLLLTFNAGSTIINQATLQSDHTMNYSPFVTAATTEFIKLVVASILLLRDLCNASKKKVIMPTNPLFILKYAIPGFLYAVCNVLNYVVVALVGSTNYQLLNNMKIITTAVIYRLTLGREIKLIQWMSILLLTLAMCVASLQSCEGISNDGSISGSESRSRSRILGMVNASTSNISSDTTNDKKFTSMTAGVLSMIFVSCLSSIAGVYNEKIIKNTPANLWYQNVLLYIWTFSFCIAKNIFSSSKSGSSSSNGLIDTEQGMFHGFTTLLWIVILMKAFYGQVVGLVFKYADNILKVYASSMSVIVSGKIYFLKFLLPIVDLIFDLCY